MKVKITNCYIAIFWLTVITTQTDARLQFLLDPLAATLNALVPQTNKAEQLLLEHMLKTTYAVLVDHLQLSTEKTLGLMVRWDIIKY